jgi:glycine/D-amino acid oxidase-like deaminating enzyme
MPGHDVIVVGAGITGLASAYHIKRNNPDMSVCLVEKEKTYAQGNTGRSAAGFRDTFTSEMNYILSSSSIEFYKHVQNKLGFNLGMDSCGYLFLLESGKLDSPAIKKVMSRSRGKIISASAVENSGINTKPEKDVAEMMNLPEIGGGFLGENCGIIEPDLICSFYDSELRKMGVELKYGTKVNSLSLAPTKTLDYPGEPFLWQDKTINSLETNSGELKAEKYVLCTDVWTTDLLAPLGIDSHTLPKKRQIFQASGKEVQNMVSKRMDGSEGTFPFLILPSCGIYLRPEPKSKSFWISTADDIGRPYSYEEDPQPEKDFYNLGMLPVAQEYIPQIKNSKITSSWAGHYAYNTIDKTHYIFESLNVIVATGTSGSGIMKGDSAGRVVSAIVSGEKTAKTFTNRVINVDELGIKKRKVEIEELVI